MKGVLQRAFAPLTLESEDYLILDVLRLLASFAIVFYHFRFQFDPVAWPVVYGQGWGNLSLAVDLFFVISGFIITTLYGSRLKSWADYRLFIVKRLARLYPLHLVTTLVFVGIGVVAWMGLTTANTPGAFDPKCLPGNLALLQAFGTCKTLAFNGVAWSVSAEMVLYLAFPLLLPLVRRPVIMALLLLVVAAGLVVASYLNVGWTAFTVDGSLFRAAPAFLIGASAAVWRGSLRQLPFARLAVCVVGVVIVLGLVLAWPRILMIVLVYGLAIAGIAASGRQVDPLTRRLAPFGQLTYSIYMLHPVVNTVFLGFVGKRVLHLDGAALAVWAVLLAAAMIPIGWVSYSMFEMPCRRQITQWFVDRRGQHDAVS